MALRSILKAPFCEFNASGFAFAARWICADRGQGLLNGIPSLRSWLHFATIDTYSARTSEYCTDPRVAIRLVVMALSLSSPNVDSTPVAGSKLLEIAIVVVLSKVCRGARCALAVCRAPGTWLDAERGFGVR